MNNVDDSELQLQNRHLSCHLRNLQVEEVVRAGNGSIDQTFALLFQSKFYIGAMQYDVRIFLFQFIDSSIIFHY